VAPARTEEDFQRYLERSAHDDFEALLLVRTGDQRIVGAVNVSQIFYGGFQSAYLGYWIGQPFARQGYMREGLALALSHVFGPLRLHRVEANVQPTNLPSRRLVQGIGFRLEGYSPRYLKVGGRWRDHERWALLREEWRSRGHSARMRDAGQ
jgi:ribosomal-protein-alanine N-acetyltransferase